MSQGRFSPPLAPEDDWFDEPEWFPEPDTPSSAGGEAPYEPPRRHAEPVSSGKRPHRRMLVAVAVLGALALVAGGVLVARALSGAGDAGEATTSTPSAPTSTTSPTTTTPESTVTTTTDTSTEPEDASLRPGEESERVRQLQEDLVALGYSTGGVDGKYGPATEEAVREFQTSSGLVVDGVAGPATLAALADAGTG